MERLDDLTREITAACMPSEVALVGMETFDEVIDAVNAGESLDLDTTTSRGRQNDIVEGIKLLFQAAAFVKVLIELYGILKVRLGRKPTADELVDEAKKNEQVAQPKQASDAAVRVIEKLD